MNSIALSDRLVMMDGSDCILARARVYLRYLSKFCFDPHQSMSNQTAHGELGTIAFFMQMTALDRI